MNQTSLMHTHPIYVKARSTRMRFTSDDATEVLQTVLNVKELGAKGDGKTDDTQVFLDAVETIRFTGGTIYVPTGRYIISRPIVLREGSISIIGEGMGATTLQLRDDLDRYVVGLIRTKGNQINKNIMIRDLTLDGNRENQDPEMTEHIGFYSGVTPDASYEDEDLGCYRVEVKNFAGYGFDPHEVTTRLHLVDCTAHNNKLDGFTIDANINVFIRGCISFNNDRHGFNIVTNTKHSIFNGNIIYNNKANGIMVQNGSSYNLFVNNSVFRNKGDGISVRGVPHNIIQNNYVYENDRYGIRVRGGDHTTISGNRLKNNGQAKDDQFDEIRVAQDAQQGSSHCMVANNHITINGRRRARYGIHETDERAEGAQEKNMFGHNKVYGAVRRSYQFLGKETEILVNT
ncbi:MAG: glycosyl hydrolase family 28-related protein [Chloroflexota bacterium]